MTATRYQVAVGLEMISVIDLEDLPELLWRPDGQIRTLRHCEMSMEPTVTPSVS